MDLEHVLAELRKERDALEKAIRSLERLDRTSSAGSGHRYDLTANSPLNGANGSYRDVASGEP